MSAEAREIRAIIVDDEEPARERLRMLLKAFEEVRLIGEAEDGEEAIEKITAHQPDLVFLDIQMPGCTGLEVATSLASPGPKIIFCTAYDQYAIDAFEVRAMDYLLKPVSRARLAKAIDRVRANASGGDGNLNRLVAESAPSRFLAKRGNKFEVVPQERVLFFSSEGGLTRMRAQEDDFWVEPGLSDLEARLAGSGFCRISRQVLVNLGRVKEVIPLIGGYGQIKLDEGTTLNVSRRKMKDLMQRLANVR